MSVLAPILARTPVTRIEDVVARMVEIDHALPARDGISCFNKLYLAVTNGVAAAAATTSFANPPFLIALDVTFANLYFAALRAYETGAAPVPSAWSPLFTARASQTIAPLQMALAGMNAHINRDLPVALVATHLALGLDMQHAGGPHDDFERVNDILATTEKQVKDTYLDPMLRGLDADFHGVDDVVAMWSVRAARDAGWTNGQALWHLRRISAMENSYLATLDRLVGFASRGLLVRTALPKL